MMLIPKWGNYPGDGGGGITLVIDTSQLEGVFGDADPAEWLRELSREMASTSGSADAEAFRLLKAPR